MKDQCVDFEIRVIFEEEFSPLAELFFTGGEDWLDCEEGWEVVEIW